MEIKSRIGKNRIVLILEKWNTTVFETVLFPNNLALTIELFEKKMNRNNLDHRIKKNESQN